MQVGKVAVANVAGFAAGIVSARFGRGALEKRRHHAN